jgi:hypothetical protein
MKLIVARAARKARRKPTQIVINLKRPLNEETGYQGVEVSKQDYEYVGEKLEGYFGPKDLVAEGLELKRIKRLYISDFAGYYDLVTATFMVKKK